MYCLIYQVDKNLENKSYKPLFFLVIFLIKLPAIDSKLSNMSNFFQKTHKSLFYPATFLLNLSTIKSK